MAGKTGVWRRVAVVSALVLAAAAGGFALIGPDRAFAQTMMSHAGGMHGLGNGPRGGGMHPHGAGGMMQHDVTNMPGLRGIDATPEESAELAVMFNNFRLIDRKVENLPNGIRTVTYSSEENVMATLVSHVTGMINRVEVGRDPQIFIQSPTLDVFFLKGDGIETDIEVTNEGIIVVQTSDDPELVEALQVHAAEVTAMAERGMAAVHDMMMQRAAN
jgi:hypothetical protein